MADKNYGLSTVVHEADSSSDMKNTADGIEEHPNWDGDKRIGFDRYINLVAIVNFGFTLQSGWEVISLTLNIALFNGGPASLVYGTLFAATGALCVASSLGEMASMDPKVGAQYRWSARFARSNPEFWGLMQGWLTVFSWVTTVASCLVPLTSATKGLLLFYHPTFEWQRWHATLFMWSFIVVAIVCNLFLRKILNTMETLGGICHVLFFVIVMTVLTTLGRRSTPDFVFKTITTDFSGWTNPVVSWSIGLLVPVIPLTCFDGVLHMIDETKQPRNRIPRSMVGSTAMNAVLVFAFSIAVLFCMGDYEKVVTSPLPILEVYYQATKSKTAATILIVMTISTYTISFFNIFASASRLTWAFARDKGLPFNQYFIYIHPKLQIPLPVLGLVSVVCGLLALLNIVSEVAFNAMLSLPTIALMVSYFIPIFFLTVRKLLGEHPQYGPFKLGRWSLPINLMALFYCAYVGIWASFPPMYPVTAQTMNYAAPILLGVLLLALLDWFTTGSKRFRVPTSEYNIEMQDQSQDIKTRSN